MIHVPGAEQEAEPDGIHRIHRMGHIVYRYTVSYPYPKTMQIKLYALLLLL